MTRHTRLVLVVAALAATNGARIAAQEAVSTGAEERLARPGWTFTPSFGFVETYDDNITMFGRGSADSENDDYISTFVPQGDLTYRGRHLRTGMGYAGSLLNYQTFTIFNRWNQRAHLDIRRDESARLQWSVHASGTTSPSTDSVDFGGIPYSHTGSTVLQGRTSFTYKLSPRDAVTSSIQYQDVRFDRPNEVRDFLRGGVAVSSFNEYRRRVSSRTSVGVDYGFRRARVVDDVEHLNLHSAQATFDYHLSPAWTIGGGGGAVYLAGTAASEAHLGPALRASANRSGRGTLFHIRYERSFIPSFGFGGTVNNQELGTGYRTQLFHSRHFYTDHSAILRNNTPLVEAPGRLRLRSLRTNSVLGWAPQPWVQLELFYARTQQTSLIAGGRLDRNRVGFRIVTSMPVRVH